MGVSTTVIGALKFKGGVVIAADSQASDLAATVRWAVEKLNGIGGYPFVAGFSGSLGKCQSARGALEATRLHPNMFDKRDRIEGAVADCLRPIYKQIKQANDGVKREIYLTGLWGLLAYWAEGGPQILECGLNGDTEFHDYFHAIGSGANTAYAVYRTLGGKSLSALGEHKALVVMLRILRTCANVELWGVSEPLSAWVISQGRARGVSQDEIQADLQCIDEWIEEERSVLFNRI